jgi:hypothetical protein
MKTSRIKKLNEPDEFRRLEMGAGLCNLRI